MSKYLLPLIAATVLVFGVDSAVSAQELNSSSSDGPRAGLDNRSSDSAPAAAKKSPGSDELVIGPDDVLVINVWKEPEVSQTVPVRPDGKISLPLIGPVMASGLTPTQLQASITHELENYLSHPGVTVIVHEVKSQRFVVVGQVAKPGGYALQTPMTVLDAIAGAGGPLEYAKLKSIYVLRTGPNGNPIRLPFNYKGAIKGKNLGQNVRLQSHDTVVVP
jgi:polysaccharide export outer membrane protein